MGREARFQFAELPRRQQTIAGPLGTGEVYRRDRCGGLDLNQRAQGFEPWGKFKGPGGNPRRGLSLSARLILSSGSCRA